MIETPKYRTNQRLKNLVTGEIRVIELCPYPTGGLFLQDGTPCYGLKRLVMRGEPETVQGLPYCPGILVVPQALVENPELYAVMKMTAR